MTIGSCRTCGAQLDPGAVFCAGCGSRVSDHAAPVPRVPTPPPAVDPPRVDSAALSPYAVVPPATGELSLPLPVPAPPVVAPLLVTGALPGAAPGRVPDAAPANAADTALPPWPSHAAPGPWDVALDRRSEPSEVGRRGPAKVVAVAPDAVAPVGRRVAAFALDLLAALVVAAAAGVVVTAGRHGGPASAGDALTVLAALALLGVGQWLAESFTGATIGSALLGIRTLSARTGRPAGLVRIVVRQLVVGLGGLVAYVGQWVVVASGAWDSGPAQRGWHDKVAGTVVLRASARGTSVPSDAAYASAVARAVRRDGGTGAAAAPAAGQVPPPPAPPVSSAPPVPAPPGPPPLPAPVVPAAPPAPPAAVAPIPVPDFARDRSTHPAGPGHTAGPDHTAGLGHAAGPGRPAPAAIASGAADGLITGPPATTGAPRPAQPRTAAPGLGDLEHTRLRPWTPPTVEIPGPPTPGLRLVFDTGQSVDVDGDGLVGRDPGSATGVAHVVAIDDPAQSVSKVHLAFGLDGAPDRLWVVDRGSTNGTFLVRPDGSRVTLPAGARASVVAGWAIVVGERVARVERR